MRTGIKSSADGIRFEDICNKFTMLRMHLVVKNYKIENCYNKILLFLLFIQKDIFILTYRTTQITFSLGVLYAEMYAICC